MELRAHQSGCTNERKVTHPGADSQLWTTTEPRRASCRTLPLCMECDTEAGIWREEKIVGKRPSGVSVSEASCGKGKGKGRGSESN